MDATNRAARRYCRSVRSWLPSGKMRRTIMAQIKDTVNEFVQHDPDADDEAIQAQLGSPQEIATAFVENMGAAEVLKGLRVRRRVLTAVFVAVLVILVSWTCLVARATIRENAHNDEYIVVDIE